MNQTTYCLSAVRRALLIKALRAVAERWYNDAAFIDEDGCSMFSNGICRAVNEQLGRPTADSPEYGYQLVSDGLRDIGYTNTFDPFLEDHRVRSGDWTVRPLFCLMFADLLEQQDAPA